MQYNHPPPFAEVTLHFPLTVICVEVSSRESNSGLPFSTSWITSTVRQTRRKIRLIEDDAKYQHLKELTCKGTLRQVFISAWGPEPQTSPPYTLLCIFIYSTSIFLHTGKGEGGRVEPERRLEGQQLTKLIRKYQHDWLYLQSINSDKHLPQKQFTCQFF